MMSVNLARSIAKLFAAYPYLRPEQVREGTQAYAEALSDLPHAAVESAVLELTRSRDRLPSIAEIRQIAKDTPPPRSQITGPSAGSAVALTMEARRIFRARLEAMHTATAELRAKHCAELNLNDGEARGRLEEEVRSRLWDAAVVEAKGMPRVPMAVTDREKAGWRNRCETWARLGVNPAMIPMVAVQTKIEEAA